jgi:hypothetical protein
MKSGNLNFLEPSGPLQACIGTALLFTSLNIKIVDIAHIQQKIHVNLGCLGRPRHRQWDNKKMDLIETG